MRGIFARAADHSAQELTRTTPVTHGVQCVLDKCPVCPGRSQASEPPLTLSSGSGTYVGLKSFVSPQVGPPSECLMSGALG